MCSCADLVMDIVVNCQMQMWLRLKGEARSMYVYVTVGLVVLRRLQKIVVFSLSLRYT